MTEVKKGDFVTVTIRGEVSEVNNRDIVVGPFSGYGCTILPRKAEGHEVQVSVVEPPVKEFGLGDRIRHRDSGFQVTICEGGYLIHHGTGEHSWSPWSPRPGQFTSEYYDKVVIE